MDEQLPLQGELSELPVPYLLASLRRQQRTGVLLLSSARSGDRSLYLMDGELIAARTDKADQRLGRRLLRSGLATRTQIERAFEALEPHLSLADVLVAHGRLSPEQRDELQTEFFRELVLSSFLISEGSFTFSPLEAIFESNLQLFHDTDELLLEGRLLLERCGPVVRMLQQDNPILARIQSATFEALTPDEEAILALADGKRPSSHVLALSPLDWLATVRALTILLDKARLVPVGKTTWQRPEQSLGFPYVSEDADPSLIGPPEAPVADPGVPQTDASKGAALDARAEVPTAPDLADVSFGSDPAATEAERGQDLTASSPQVDLGPHPAEQGTPAALHVVDAPSSERAHVVPASNSAPGAEGEPSSDLDIAARGAVPTDGSPSLLPASPDASSTTVQGPEVPLMSAPLPLTEDPESLRRTVLLPRARPQLAAAPSVATDSSAAAPASPPAEASTADSTREGSPAKASSVAVDVAPTAQTEVSSVVDAPASDASSSDASAAAPTLSDEHASTPVTPASEVSSAQPVAIHPEEPEIQELWVEEKVFQPRDHSNPQAGVFLSGDSVLDTIDLSHIQSFHIASDIPLDGIVEAGSAEDEGHEYEQECYDEDEDSDDSESEEPVEDEEHDHLPDGFEHEGALDPDARGHSRHPREALFDGRTAQERAQDQELDPGDELIEELSRLGTPADLARAQAMLEQSLFSAEAAPSSETPLAIVEPAIGEALPPLDLGLDLLENLPNEGHASGVNERLRPDATASEATGELDRIVLSADDFASIEDSVSVSIPPIVQELDEDEPDGDLEGAGLNDGWEDGSLFPAQSVLSGSAMERLVGIPQEEPRSSTLVPQTITESPPPVAGLDEEEALDLSPDAIHEMTFGGEGARLPVLPTRLEPPPPREDQDEELPLFPSQAPSSHRALPLSPLPASEDEALFSAMRPLGSSARPHREGWGAPDKLNPEEQALLDLISQMFPARSGSSKERTSKPKRRGSRADMRRTGIVVALTNAQKALLRDRAEMYNHIFTVIFGQLSRKLGRERARQAFQDFFESSNGVHPELFTNLSFKADGMIDSEMLIRNLESYPNHRPIQLFETCLQDIFQFLMRQTDHLLEVAEQGTLMDHITPIFNLLNKRPETGA